MVRPDHPLPTVCILAGGLGTRLGAYASGIPKPLIETAGAPFLLHQLRLLATHGVRNVVLCVGHLGELVEREIGSERFGICIDYSYDGEVALGTLGAVRNAAPRLGDRFLVLYGDTYLRIDYAAAADAWTASGLPAMMTVLRNEGRWDTSNARFDGKLVTAYEKRGPQPDMSWIDYGLGGLDKQALAHADGLGDDLADLYSLLADRRLLFGYPATERFYEIGTPEALAETSAFLETVTRALS